MTYLLRPKPPKTSAGRNALRAVGVIAVLAIIFSFIAPRVLPQVLGVIVSPLWQARTALVGGVSNMRLFSTRNALVAENNKLREENEAFRLDALKLELLSSENRELRTLLGARETPQGVAAAVRLHPSQTYYDIFIVDKVPGASLGGLAIRGQVALGPVSEDLGSSLKIVLYSSPSVKTEGRLAQNGTPVELEGKGGGNFTAVVPRDLAVAVGDLVVLPHSQNFVIARIESIDTTETDSFKLLRAAVPLNIFTLRWLEIITNE